MRQKIFPIEFQKSLEAVQRVAKDSSDKSDMTSKVDALRKTGRKDLHAPEMPKPTTSGLSRLLLKIGQIASALDQGTGASPILSKPTSKGFSIPSKILGFAHQQASSHIQDFKDKATQSQSVLTKGVEKLKEKKGIFHSIFSGIAMVFSLKSAATEKKKTAFVPISRAMDQCSLQVGLLILSYLNQMEQDYPDKFAAETAMVRDYLFFVSGLRQLRATAQSNASTAPAVLEPQFKLPPTDHTALMMDSKDIPKELTQFHRQIVSIEQKLDKIIMHIEVILVNSDGIRINSESFLTQLGQVLSTLESARAHTHSDDGIYEGLDDFQVNQTLYDVNDAGLDHQAFCLELLDVVDYTLDVLAETHQEMENLLASAPHDFTPQMETLIIAASISFNTLLEDITQSLTELRQSLNSLQEASTFDLRPS